MADIYYNQGKKALWSDDIDGATLKVALLTSSYSPDKDADHFWSDISGNEVTGTNYTAGGFALDNVAASIDDANDRGVLDADNEAPTTVTITNARYSVLYIDTGTSTDSQLLLCWDLGSDVSCLAGTLTWQFHADGIAYVGE